MSSPAISGGTSLFTGFTRLCKGLAVVLGGGHIILQILPSSVDYLALIPARYDMDELILIVGIDLILWECLFYCSITTRGGDVPIITIDGCANRIMQKRE
ncbi:hypothetical protein RHMOL_Rhmol03G0141000 [Rhododendron molle]|uniref:Uncharacterized protein n=1 Tax=Rhododendron molle TaxID=49168 RepID=A0ACC0PGE3_RHOML|nr:hypothetical protein RHMOL_Rhmol03G0141000 [Rhododendron molle]